MKTDTTQILEWLRGKIEQAEQSLRAREQAEAVFRGGTDESWAAAAELHPDTAGKPMPRGERLRAAKAQGRIAVGCRRDVEMFKAVYDALCA